MNRVVLAGCRSEPLSSYLQGLGAWRAIVRTVDAHAQAYWCGGQFMLETQLDLDGVVEQLASRFTPMPIVSPWNAGSGFAGNGKSVEAERALDEVRRSSDPRLGRLRAAVSVADDVVAEGRRRGWSGAKGELWDKTRKVDMVQLCRNRLPDDALAWIDVAVVLGQDGDPTYSRLLGTGGNFGRQDLAATYVQRVLTVLGETPQHLRSASWLRAALTGDESVPYLRETVGQFDPGRAGGIQSSPLEAQDKDGFANPWSFLLVIEGALLFASAVVRRQGALMSRAAAPFMVPATAVGFSTGAAGETVHGEIWTPEWDRPAHLAEIEHLLGEGRADWGAGTARTGLDFVRAVATLGVDRGVSYFTRHIFAERLGQSPLAVPVGRVAVVPRGPVGLLAALDPWLGRLRSGSAPTGVQTALRQVNQALYDTAAPGDDTSRLGDAARLRAVVIAVGRLHETVARSTAARGLVDPLMLDGAEDWWDALQPTDSAELRVAGALASGRDGLRPADPAPELSLRLLLTPVVRARSHLGWSDRPPLVSAPGVVDAIALAHRRRAFPGAVADPYDSADDPQPAVRGVLSAYQHGIAVPLSDVVDFANGRLDDDMVWAYLRGLMVFDWSAIRRAERDTTTPTLLPPALALLLPFYSVKPLRLRVNGNDEPPRDVVLRPGEQWVAELLATGPARPVRDAVRRLRVAGFPDLVGEDAVARSELEGRRLAAALLLRVTSSARTRALVRVAALPNANDRHRFALIEGAPS